MKDQPVEIIKHLEYIDILDQFEKYHYRKMTIEISKTGHVDIIKNKIIK